MRWPWQPAEKRMITEIPGIERPGANLLQVFGLGDVTLPSVTIDSALTVPAVLAAVSFLPRSLASVPLHVHRSKGEGSERIKGGLEKLIHAAPNPEWTSFRLRQYFWTQVFTGGRGLLWIERSGSAVTGLYPINPKQVQIKRSALGETTYEVGGRVYPSSDIIDVPFMLKSDGLAHYSPITLGAPAIQLALAMGAYGSKFFAGGGVPPLAFVGPLATGKEGLNRQMSDVARAIDHARESGTPMFPIPPGYDLKPVGFDPEKGQMTDARRFSVEEIARIFGLPPVFLQDLTHGTFTNTEQQDLFFVKHLIGQWAQALEQEMNLKLFGQRNGGRYVAHNLDGLLRGDFKTRADAVASLVQCGVYTPNAGAKYMGQEPSPDPAAERLYMQSGTIPLGSQPEQQGQTDDDGA